MEWLFSGFLGLLSQVVIFVIKFFVGKIMTPIAMSTALFDLYFPAVKRYIWIFQGLALCILVIIDLVQLMRGMLFKTANGEVDHPGVLMTKSAFAVIFIICSVPLMNFFLETIRLPYTYRDAGGNYFQMDAEEDLFSGGFTDLMSSVYSESQKMDVSEAVAGQITGVAAAKNLGEIAGFAISLILMVILGWQMIRYLLEILERFVILMLLLFTAMFPMAAFPSRATAGIFRKWLEMLFSTALLCFFNMFFLRVISGGFSLVYGSANHQPLSGGAVTNPVLGTFMILAMLRTARQWDHYMTQLFTAAETGMGMGWEIMSAGIQLFGHPPGGALFGGSGRSSGIDGGFNRGGFSGEPVMTFTNSGAVSDLETKFLSGGLQKAAADNEKQETFCSKLSVMSEEGRRDFIKGHAQMAAGDFFGRGAPGHVAVSALHVGAQGELCGTLRDNRGTFADFEISDIGGVGAFKLDGDAGYLTLNPENTERSLAFMAALEGSGGQDFGASPVAGQWHKDYFRAGSLCLEADSLGAFAPETRSVACTGPGQYALYDNDGKQLGNLEMIFGSHPSERVVTGERCNYNFSAYKAEG